MKKLIGGALIIPVAVAIFIFADSDNRVPEGWFAAGSNPAEYEMGIDNSTFQNGHSSAYLKSKNPKANEFGTLMQTISAENYLDKRFRLSGYIKSEKVTGWAAMWMRIDGEEGTQLGFDNMFNRQVKGTTDWKKYEIVLDVPSGSKTINYGLMLGGNGTAWFDNLKLEEVDKTVPVTNLRKENNPSKHPINLDFED